MVGDETHFLHPSCFLPDIIRHAVWLYHRFTLSYRNVEDLPADRGLEVSKKSIRRWVLKFGSAIARNHRSVRRRLHDHLHLGGRVVSIGGQRMYMWRAVDSTQSSGVPRPTASAILAAPASKRSGDP